MCGREFFDDHNSYDWEEGELEKLRLDPKATAVDYSVGTICFEGREYVMDCDCWHERARKIKAWLDGHDHRIAEYLTLEKQRLQAAADNAPTVKNFVEVKEVKPLVEAAGALNLALDDPITTGDWEKARHKVDELQENLMNLLAEWRHKLAE